MMTDQQAPERIVKILRNHAEDPMWADHCEMHKTVAAKAADMIEALAKQRDELAAIHDELAGMRDEDGFLGTVAQWIEDIKLERDQALASVGAVIVQAAAMVAIPDADDDALDRQTRLIASEQLRCDFNPDATAALNEMLAEAWKEGWQNRSGPVEKMGQNPYRRDET